MKKVLVLSTCLLFLPVIAIAGNDWLNYEKEAQIVGRGVCDNDKTKVTLYDHMDYELMVAATASGETYLYFYTNEGEKFFMKSGDKTVEMPHEAWDQSLKSASPNWYAYMHGGQHGCRKTN